MNNKLKNENERISANEINKYLYCPYQWYYERYYGRKHIQELYRQRNERLGLKNTTLSNFHRGLAFHNGYERADKRRRFVKKLAVCILLTVLLGLTLLVWKEFFSG